MRVGIASDHRGYKLKEKLKKYMEKKGIEYIDYGTDSEVLVDYPDYAYSVCEGVLKKDTEVGVLICGTGIGMSIAANKIKGIMCAKVDCKEEAKLCREHNHANVISMSSELFYKEARDILIEFINGKPNMDERYVRRINKVIELEKLKKIK